jgi:hypothetical protein
MRKGHLIEPLEEVDHELVHEFGISDDVVDCDK